MSLFETAEYDTGPAEDASLSYNTRLKLRQQATLDRGIHPVTNLPLLPSGTCGECKFCVGRHLGKTYYKCRVDGDRFVTGGLASDVRLRWPACSAFEKEATDG